MADIPASASSIGYTDSEEELITLKVINYEFDPELVIVRTLTSDQQSWDSPRPCAPRSVHESVGGILRGTGYVDPSESIIAYMLASVTTPTDAGKFDEPFLGIRLVLDMNKAEGSRDGYNMGFLHKCKLYMKRIYGQTDDGGMIMIDFEIHSQNGVLWSTTET